MRCDIETNAITALRGGFIMPDMEAHNEQTKKAARHRQ
jgi:hypothetical protein